MTARALLCGLGLLQGTSACVPHSSADITGVVITRPGRHLVPGATVAIPAWAVATVTDSAGRFRLRAPLTTGCWRILTRAPGFNWASTYVALRPGHQDVGDLPLESDIGTRTGILDRRCFGDDDPYTGFSWPILASGRLRGTLTDQADSVVVGAYLDGRCDIGEVSTSRTDSLGHFELSVALTRPELEGAGGTAVPDYVRCRLHASTAARNYPPHPRDTVAVRLGPWPGTTPTTQLGRIPLVRWYPLAPQAN